MNEPLTDKTIDDYKCFTIIRELITDYSSSERKAIQKEIAMNLEDILRKAGWSLTLTVTKDVITSGETVTVTAKILNEDGEPVEGIPVEFYN